MLTIKVKVAIIEQNIDTSRLMGYANFIFNFIGANPMKLKMKFAYPRIPFDFTLNVGVSRRRFAYVRLLACL